MPSDTVGLASSVVEPEFGAAGTTQRHTGCRLPRLPGVIEVAAALSEVCPVSCR